MLTMTFLRKCILNVSNRGFFGYSNRWTKFVFFPLFFTVLRVYIISKNSNHQENISVNKKILKTMLIWTFHICFISLTKNVYTCNGFLVTIHNISYKRHQYENTCIDISIDCFFRGVVGPITQQEVHTNYMFILSALLVCVIGPTTFKNKHAEIFTSIKHGSLYFLRKLLVN